MPLKTCIDLSRYFFPLLLQFAVLSSVPAQKSITYSLHTGIGVSWAKINELQTDWYYYQTWPKASYNIGLKADYPLTAWLSASADLGIIRSGFQGRRIEEVLIDTNNITGNRREYWSDFAFYNAALKLGLEGNLNHRFSLGVFFQAMRRVGIVESRQERWLSSPVYLSKAFPSERVTDHSRFRKHDYGINILVSHRISKKVAASFDFYYTRHSFVDSLKGDWLENRLASFNLYYFIN